MITLQFSARSGVHFIRGCGKKVNESLLKNQHQPNRLERKTCWLQDRQTREKRVDMKGTEEIL